MDAETIRQKRDAASNKDHPRADARNVYDEVWWLSEIAAQLAELNTTLAIIVKRLNEPITVVGKPRDYGPL